jgi:deoxyguanosine kinase
MVSIPIERDHVVIEGNIGSGKTTLARILSERWGSRLMLEQFSDNPFLPKFYQNPQKHAFALELSFLAERYHQNRNELNQTDLFRPGVVSDYSFVKSLIFAKINLPDDEFELYQTLFHIIHGRLPKPDRLIYLLCSEQKSLRQISKRGREYETGIDEPYLRSINNGYLTYFKQLKDTCVLIINTENIDFVESLEDRELLLEVVGQTYTQQVHQIKL